MTSSAAVTPLNGIKVVEIGQNIAGPYASEILSSLGAEVKNLTKTGMRFVQISWLWLKI